MFTPRSKVARKVLNYFFLNESSRLYVNEAARLLQEDPKNVYRVLVMFEGEGLLTSEFKGRERYFGANRASPGYKNYKAVFLRGAGVESLLKDALAGLSGLEAAYIFGSYANAGFGAQSDIDMLLVGSHEPLAAEKAVHKLRKSLGRELNLVNMTGSEFARKSGKDQFLKGVFGKKTIKLV
ncbi:MAG TPA: nucleotidyltransferase domain-containing protein [Elusimicrobiales bacterium]|nr:nucleotidyltransferase domain-containing protein [Elusimicrobiales bacterium]